MPVLRIDRRSLGIWCAGMPLRLVQRVRADIRQMDAGDSIRIPLDERIPARDVYDLQRRMSQAANNILGRGNYSVRIIEADAVRLWRLA